MDGHDDSLLTRFPAVPRRKLTVSDYHRMGAAGILTAEDRVELVEGELVAMAPIGSEHAHTVNTIARLLIMAVGDRAVVAVQNPVRLDQWSEPQPDFAVLRARAGGYRAALPTPEDVLLAIEVANTSLGYDRGPKRALYARHHIAELWIVDLAAGVVEVCRAPDGDTYAAITRVDRNGTLDIEGLTDLRISAATLFG